MSSTPAVPCICMRLMSKELSELDIHIILLQLKLVCAHYQNDNPFTEFNIKDLYYVINMFEDALMLCPML